jgi:Ulp1 family protease
MITDDEFTYFPPAYSVPKQTNGYDCGVFVCRYAYALYQARFTPITYVDLHLEKPPLKTAITQSNFFNFDDLEVTLLRTEVGVLNSDLKEDRKEEEKIQSESTMLCKFVEESMTEVPDIVTNPQQVSKKQKDVF